MPYRVLAVCAIMACSYPASGAAARLPDVAPMQSIKRIEAIHRPTGCVARLEFSDRTLLGAIITDPLCLPVGVKARPIPAFLRDFHVPASKREIIRVR